MAVKGISAISGKHAEYANDAARGPGPSQQEQLEVAKLSKNSIPGREADYEIENISDILDDLNSAVDVFNKGLHFKVHEDTERIVVEVVNKDSGEVIRQIPPEYILDIMAKIDALLGVFVDEKA